MKDKAREILYIVLRSQPQGQPGLQHEYKFQETAKAKGNAWTLRTACSPEWARESFRLQSVDNGAIGFHEG